MLSHRLLLLSLLSLAGPAAAGEDPALFLRDLSTARALGMGNAFRALGFGTEAVMGSPAAISLQKRYEMELGGSWDTTSKVAYGSSGMLDSLTSSLAAGVAYQLVSDGHGADRQLSHLNTVGLALPVTEGVHLGASARQLLKSGAHSANAVTMDVGLAFSFASVFNLAVSAHNLVDTRHSELQRFYSLGLGLVTRQFNLGADVHGEVANFAWNRLSYNAGAEFLPIPQLALRGGYSWDGLDARHSFSAGVGINIDGGGLDLAYRKDLSGPNQLLIASFRFNMGQGI